jgi:hypothetical protein
MDVITISRKNLLEIVGDRDINMLPPHIGEFILWSQGSACGMHEGAIVHVDSEKSQHSAMHDGVIAHVKRSTTYPHENPIV